MSRYPVSLGDTKLLVVRLPVCALAALAAVGHEVAPRAFEVGDTGAAQYSEAAGASLGVKTEALFLWEIAHLIV